MPPGQSVAEVSSRFTTYADSTTQHEQAAAQRRSDHSTKVKRANDPRHPVCPASERPVTQSARNNASVGVPGCLTPRLQLNAQFTTCYRCYAMPSSSKKPRVRVCFGVHRSVTTYHIIDHQPNFSRKLLWVHLSE